MNREKWENAPLAHLVTKLAEECGEVAKAMNDSREASSLDKASAARRQLIRECDDVIFIAEQTKEATLAVMGMRPRHA